MWEGRSVLEVLHCAQSAGQSPLVYQSWSGVGLPAWHRRLSDKVMRKIVWWYGDTLRAMHMHVTWKDRADKSNEVLCVGASLYAVSNF